MDMKLYGIIESYQDYKGADATNWGVCKTVKEALETLRGIIEQQFYYIYEGILYDMEEEMDIVDAEEPEHIKAADVKWTEWFNEHLTEGSRGNDGYEYKWVYDDGDCVYKFYIDEINLEM